MLSVSEIKRHIQEDQASVKKQHAKKAMLYYEGRHDIKDFRIFFTDDDGLLREDTTKNNSRISHPFFTELTDQCVQYMLSGDTDFVRSDIPELQNYLNEYFNDEFKMELNDLLTYTGVEGFSYLYRFMGEDMKSKFRFADGLNTVEVPAKYSSDGQNYIIYYYYWKTEKNKDIYRVEVWDNQKVYFYTMTNGTVKPDKERKERYHVQYVEGNDDYIDTFNDVPFIRLDNNRKQFSDLKVVKDLIDDYDLMSCGLSNNIQDLSEGFYVVKGFNGHDMGELTQAIKAKKRVGVGENGDVDIKTINIPYEARKVKLELDEKNIYRSGMGFDSSKSETSNVTNVVIKSRYALLDLKANKKEMQLKRMMNKVIKIVLDEINRDNKTAYEMKDVYIVFDRVVPSNETDNATIAKTEADTRQVEINTLLNLASYLDNETLMQNICTVLEIDYEEIKEKLPTDEIETSEAENILESQEVEDEVVEA